MKIIPAIDIIDGCCVRLTQGDYSKMKIYSKNPLDIAMEFEDAGITSLHLVDLDGAKLGAPKNLQILELISRKTNLSIDFGGGIKSTESLELAFNAGAHAITAGTISIKEPKLVERWVKKYNDRIVLGADAKNGFVAINGWESTSNKHVINHIENFLNIGIKTVICTDISKDGMLRGPSYDLYHMLQKEFPKMNLIASGGISSIDDLTKLKQNGLYGAIIGKAIYEGHITLKELKELC